jgi:hypothetical protein
VLSLVDAGSYRLADATASYDLASTTWDVYVTSADPSRLRISIFQYSSVECPDSRTAFETFQQILGAKVRSLRGMFNATDHRYDYLFDLSVTSAGQHLDMSARAIQDYWTRTASLQVLSGLCFKKPDAEFMRSEIYFGSTGGSLPEPLIADLPLSADELGAARDIHTASILYALARDAKRMQVDRDIVISYLGMARQLSAEIPTDGAVKLRQAIQSTLSELGAPGRLKL